MKVHITGGLGFVGSNLVRYLNKKGIRPIIYDFYTQEKWKNVVGLDFVLNGPKTIFISSTEDDVLIHLAADTDTRVPFSRDLMQSNVVSALSIMTSFRGKVIYASSAAVYGAEEVNFSERIEGLKPLNAYGFSKWYLDKEVFEIQRLDISRKIYGLRFFNVYGPNESHKLGMASVVHQALNQLHPIYQDEDIIERWYDLEPRFRACDPFWCLFEGSPARDFICVEDVCSVICFFIEGNADSGIYNVGTGRAEAFSRITSFVNPQMPVRYRPIPDRLREQYQMITCADIKKLRNAGYRKDFMGLFDGINFTKNETRY